jgi:PAS domain S-box-containing protein
MYSILSTLPIILGSIVGYLGLYYLYIYFRLNYNREYLAFAITCLCVAAYDFFSAGLYSSVSVSEGVMWQRFQYASMALGGIAFIQFIYSHLSHKEWKIFLIFYAYLIFAAAIQITDRSGLTWKINQSNIKEIFLPFGEKITYYEGAQGVLTDLQGVIGLLVFVYLFFVSLSHYRSGLKKRSKLLLLSLFLFFVGIFNDLAVVSGYYKSIYIIEYSFMGMILLMAYSLTNELMEATIIKKELIASEEKHRKILETIEDGYYEVDLAGTLTFFNDSFCRILQYSRDELIGINNRQFMDKTNAKKVFNGFNWVYRTGNSYKGFDWELIKKNGSNCSVETSVSLKKGPEGQPIGFQGIMRDVTERKRLEDEKLKLEHKLRHAEKMEAMGTLAGGVAHDLNNVLSGIVGYPELLLLQLPKDSPLRKPILAMQESGLKAAAIVNDLLSMARRSIVDFTVLNLNTVISEYLKSPEYEKMKSFYPRIEVEALLDTNLLNILGSHVHISKVLMNLVSNSAEAIGDAGRIRITTSNRYIDMPISGYENIEEGNYVVLTISDSGSGIHPEDMKRIFEPFYTKKKMGKSGTGLGLAVVWGTVKDHKGFIDLNSAEGQGSTFTLYFPVTQKELTLDKSIFSIENYKGKGQSILVVDDVKEQRELLSSILTTLGYSVITVSNGKEAVDFLHSNIVDLIILDMIMDPGMDGLDTYKQIIKEHPKQKAIIASGYSETNRVKESQRLGAGNFIKKPYTLEKIGLAVKEELEEELIKIID